MPRADPSGGPRGSRARCGLHAPPPEHSPSVVRRQVCCWGACAGDSRSPRSTRLAARARDGASARAPPPQIPVSTGHMVWRGPLPRQGRLSTRGLSPPQRTRRHARVVRDQLPAAVVWSRGMVPLVRGACRRGGILARTRGPKRRSPGRARRAPEIPGRRDGAVDPCRTSPPARDHERVLLDKAKALVGGRDAHLIVDDTALVKKGTHSVGVAEGSLGAPCRASACSLRSTLCIAFCDATPS
jgi:hypothetical protein